jgi:hypothetical protein
MGKQKVLDYKVPVLHVRNIFTNTMKAKIVIQIYLKQDTSYIILLQEVVKWTFATQPKLVNCIIKLQQQKTLIYLIL